ncbi:MAG: chemotaxis protein CheX [Phycisphaerae bacterium]|nr:chemotaxis protein CheX [Phycisphaerae bacterium]
MSDPHTQQLLNSVAQETFETLAFMYSVHEQDSPAGPPVTAEVSFRGPIHGRLVLTVSDTMLPALGTNMLGFADDQAASDDQQRDALKEVLNVICGNLLPLLYNRYDVFDVQAPVIPASPTSPDVPVDGQTRLYLDGGQVHMALYVETALNAKVA